MAPKRNNDSDTSIAVTEEFFCDRKDWPRWSKALVWVLRSNNASYYVNMENLTPEGVPSALEPPGLYSDLFNFLGVNSRNYLLTLQAFVDGTVLMRTSCTKAEFYVVSTVTEK